LIGYPEIIPPLSSGIAQQKSGGIPHASTQQVVDIAASTSSYHLNPPSLHRSREKREPASPHAFVYSLRRIRRRASNKYA
jgi:hypothetical protein